MSHEGKMRRGKQYLNTLNLPKNLQNDVNYFLSKTQPEPIEKPIKPNKEKKKNDN